MDNPDAFFSALGWEARVTECGGKGANYGRWIEDSSKKAAKNVPHVLLVLASR
jgi:hypothetical protein